MSTVPLIPESAPFTSEQRAWLNGFLAAWLARQETGAAGAAPPAASGSSLLILFGSQSGNAEGLAKKIGKMARTKKLDARVSSFESASPTDLSKEPHVLAVTSTWGEGEMPDNAKTFWERLSNGSSPDLKNTKFAVLALGDKNYGDTFCLAGRQFDERFAQLGGTRLHPRIDCDVEFEEQAELWINEVLAKIENTSAISVPVSLESKTDNPQSTTSSGYSRKQPFPAKLLNNLTLNGAGSAKDVRHIEFSLEGSGLEYEVGDALGIYPTNCPEYVSEILQTAGLKGDEEVELENTGKVTLRQALLQHLELRPLFTKPLESGLNATALVEKLRPLQPRLYSIASSPKAHPGQVHLTVGAVRFELDGKPRKGACSTFLADRLSL